MWDRSEGVRNPWAARFAPLATLALPCLAPALSPRGATPCRSHEQPVELVAPACAAPNPGLQLWHGTNGLVALPPADQLPSGQGAQSLPGMEPLPAGHTVIWCWEGMK